jgi:hypothetical protein
MLNGRTILHGILFVFFAAVAFGQEPSDPNIITVTEKIDLRELNTTVKTLNTTVGELNKTVGDLKTTVEDLKVTVGKIDERTQGIAKVQHVILASIIAPLVVAIIAPIVYYILTEKIINKRNKNDTASTQTAQANQSETASTNPAQVNKGEAAHTPNSPSEFPEGEELKEYLKSDSFATREKV